MVRITLISTVVTSVLVYFSHAAPQPSTTTKQSPTTIPYPPLTGSHKIGTMTFELVDESREDPYAPVAQKRKLMVQIFYPTEDTKGRTVASIFRPKTAAYLDNLHGLPPGTLEKFQTHAYQNASILSSEGRNTMAVTVFSHSFNTPRGAYTSYLENLASEGFLVIAIDHTYDSTIVEFPNGEMIEGKPIVNTTEDTIKDLDVRTEDIKFVIDYSKRHLWKNIHGCSSLASARVGVAGHLLGGATALQALETGHKYGIVGAADIDGTFVGDEIKRGSKLPFLLIGDSNHTRKNDTSWAKGWKHLKGWKAETQLAGSTEETFLDFPVILELLGLTKKIDPNGAQFGTIGGIRSSVVVSKYLAAFFNFALKGEKTKMFNGPSAEYPEMTVVPN